ncbi:hypothetical protein GH857_29875 [Bacillus thuringiensis]|nr:hypothetical protein [Bacillus thuringiensis]
MKKHQIIWTIVSRGGNRDAIGPLVMYATTENIIKHRLDKELHRRMGVLYQWEIDVQQIENEQLILF